MSWSQRRKRNGISARRRGEIHQMMKLFEGAYAVVAMVVVLAVAAWFVDCCRDSQ